jgi:hypothetical protein
LGLNLGGGFDTGRSVSDTCFVVDSPGVTFSSAGTVAGPFAATTINGQPICRIVSPFSANTQFKVFGSYPFPGDFRLSGTLQNTAGKEILANYPARNAEVAPSLGRNLAAGVNGTTTVPLIPSQSMFESRRTQLDLRLTKLLRSLAKYRLEASLDVYNVLNASDVNLSNATYGPTWRRPINDTYSGGAILTGRLFEFGGRLTF